MTTPNEHARKAAMCILRWKHDHSELRISRIIQQALTAQKAETLDAILVELAGRGVPTPEKTYKSDGGLPQALSDIRRAITDRNPLLREGADMLDFTANTMEEAQARIKELEAESQYNFDAANALAAVLADHKEQYAQLQQENSRQKTEYATLYERFQENERLRRQMQRQGEELSDQCDKHVATIIKGMREALEEVEQCHQEADENGCTCYSDPDGPCRHCNPKMAASEITRKALSLWQPLPTPPKPCEERS